MSLLLMSSLLNHLGALGHFIAYPSAQDFVAPAVYIPLPVLVHDHVFKPNTNSLTTKGQNNNRVYLLLPKLKYIFQNMCFLVIITPIIITSIAIIIRSANRDNASQ